VTVLGIGWLLSLAAAAALTLWGVFRGGRELNDFAVATVVIGCFGVYAWVGMGSIAALEGWVELVVLAGLGSGAASLVVPFLLLARRLDPRPGLQWGLMWASQPAYAFAFWAGCGLLPALLWRLVYGGPLLWIGPWLWVALALALWGSCWAALRAQTQRRHRIVLPGLETGPLRIAHLSDLHVGPTLPSWRLRSLLTRVAALEPDLVLVTGDLVGPFSDAPGEHQGLVDGLAALPAPVLLCPGNHDMPRWESLSQELRDGGLTLLDDSFVELELRGAALWVFGLGFRWGEPGEASRAVLAGARPPAGALRLLLSHDPRGLLAAPAGLAQLGFAGHTHGGPVSLAMFGLPLSILRLSASHDAGLARRGEVWHHVHSGNLEVGVPPRIGTAAEIVLVELLPGPLL
jgi:predicted MPP superfamily phosphohydrolase